MSWRYGIVKEPEGYIIAEIYRGRVCGYANAPRYFDSPEEVIRNLRMMLKDSKNHPVYRPRKKPM